MVRKYADTVVIEQSSITGDRPVVSVPVRKDWYVVWDFPRLEIIPRGMFLRNYLTENPLGNKKRKEADNAVLDHDACLHRRPDL
jgi:hypothetical protein